MKVCVILSPIRQAAFAAAVGVNLLIAPNVLAQAIVPATEVECVIVTGSNIPTAEEVGSNPVDTYRPQDIAKLG
jgi:hypothetical protein